MADEGEELVTVVNTVNRRTQSMSKLDAVQFLRKHTLFRLVEKAPVDEPKRKVRKILKKPIKNVVKEEELGRGRKRKEADSGSGGPTPKSSGSEVGHEPKKRRGEATSAGSMPPVRLNPLIILSLREMHEVVRLFTNSPAGCVDWQMISDTATGGRVPAADVEYAANEFLPHVHYRPSIGQVVMERQSKIPSEYSKHRQTVKRMRHGLGPLLCKLKTYFIKDVIVAEDSSPSVGVEENSSELKKRASLAIARLEKGDVPLYALRQAPVARIDGEAGSLSATGRVRKRYETKAMRLAKQAVEAESLNSVVSISTTSEKTEVKSEDPGTGQHFSVPPFFHATARQFAKSSSTSSVEE